MGHRRSVSQLNSFTGCGERYRLERKVQGLPEMPAAWTAVGIAMHSAYEGWERAGRKGFTLAQRFLVGYDLEIQALQEKQPDQHWWSKTPTVKSVDQDIKLRREHGIKQADAYEESCRGSAWQVLRLPDGELALEIPVDVMFGGTRVVGYVDKVEQWPDGSLVAVDIKTGNKGNPTNRQLGFYKFGLKNKFDLDIKLGQFWYTKLGYGSSYVDLSRYTLEYLTDQYTKLDDAIEREHYLANPGPHCGMCAVKQWCREMGVVGKAK